MSGATVRTAAEAGGRAGEGGGAKGQQTPVRTGGLCRVACVCERDRRAERTGREGGVTLRVQRAARELCSEAARR